MEALLTLLTILGGLTEVGGFVVDHPKFWKTQANYQDVKAQCATAFKSYDWDKEIWYGKAHGVEGWHHCPPGRSAPS